MTDLNLPEELTNRNVIIRYKGMIIHFSRYPLYIPLVPSRAECDAERDKEAKYPLIVIRSFVVKVYYLGKVFTIEVPAGRQWDGMTINAGFLKYFIYLIVGGTSISPRFAIPSLIHDCLCDHHELINENSDLCSLMFEGLLWYYLIEPWRLKLITTLTNLWQKFVVRW